jgi:receptor-type tyrosine-protein phosphatase beta
MYTIIVAEDDTKNASGLEMPSWRDVQKYSVWPPYQAIEPYYPFRNSSIEDFTIGVDECDVHRSSYCNGPLKSGTVYRVKVRAFTALDKFTDTDPNRCDVIGGGRCRIGVVGLELIRLPAGR